MADLATKEAFKSDSGSFLWKMDSGDKLIIMGDFKAR